jgi:hypothetical protein
MRWWFVLAVTAQAFGQGPPASITGSVINALTGEPVEGAAVIARQNFSEFGFRERPTSTIPPRNADRVLTGEAGTFSIDIDPSTSSLALWISHPGFRTEDNRDTATLTLPVASANHVTVRLVPQAAVLGRVVDSHDQPLSRIRVHAIRVDIRDGRRQLEPVSINQFSSDTGEYRLENLPPGWYCFRADGLGYGPAYFPSSPIQDAAHFVRIAPAQIFHADFRLEPAQGFTIRGKVTNLGYRRRLSVRLLRGDEALDNQVAVHPDTGLFEIANVTPGSYAIQAYAADMLPLALGEAIVDISDHDVTVPSIALQTGSDVVGRVDFGSVEERYAMVYATRVSSPPLPIAMRTPSVMVQPDGRFMLHNLPAGKYEITVRAYRDAYVAGIFAGSTDVLAEGLNVARGGAPDLKVSLQPKGARIEGVVQSEHPGAAFNVALIRGGWIAAVVRAAQGKFRASGLPPGHYKVLAWPDSRTLEYRNAWVLSGLADYAVPVELDEGASKTLAVLPIPEQPLQ